MSDMKEVRLLRCPGHHKVLYALGLHPKDKVVWVQSHYLHNNEVNTHVINTYAKRTGTGEMDYDIFCKKVKLK
jgi:hypothetical protein